MRIHGTDLEITSGTKPDLQSGIFTAEEYVWLANNAGQIKSIIAGNGRISLDMRTQIELWTRRMSKQESQNSAVGASPKGKSGVVNKNTCGVAKEESNQQEFLL